METRYAILATAGHIDHGKTALVKALTGYDPDRLPEEKQRGMTIELGFAHLEVPGYSLGLVDVPGHQDFVKNMVAGVGAVDLAPLVVAADDGWMPQTEEHLQILTYLGVTRGVVALTKSDLVDDPAQRIDEIRHQLAHSPLADIDIVPTSAQTGSGLAALRKALSQAAHTLPEPVANDQPRLAVDRVFSLPGTGTVVTGTLTGGSLQQGQTIAAHPPGAPSRIRSLQSHHHAQTEAPPHTRTALGLSDLSHHDIPRGATITLPDLAGTTDTLDVWLERSSRLPRNATPLRSDTRVRLHHGSGHWPARLVLMEGKTLNPGESRLAQLRLEQPARIWPGDRFVIRNWPESATLAGGRVLDTAGDRTHWRAAAHQELLRLRAAHPSEAGPWITAGLKRNGIARRTELLRPSHFSAAETENALASLLDNQSVTAAGPWIVDTDRWQKLQDDCASLINAEHEQHPERPGLSLDRLRPMARQAFEGTAVFEELLKVLEAQGFQRQQTYLAAATHKPALPAPLRDSGKRIQSELATADPPARRAFNQSPTDRAALQFLIDSGDVVEVSRELVMRAAHYNRLRGLVKQYLREYGQGTASELRKAMEITRRIVIPLLEKMDRDGLTVRRGDVRVLRKEED